MDCNAEQFFQKLLVGLHLITLGVLQRYKELFGRIGGAAGLALHTGDCCPCQQVSQSPSAVTRVQLLPNPESTNHHK